MSKLTCPCGYPLPYERPSKEVICGRCGGPITSSEQEKPRA